MAYCFEMTAVGKVLINALAGYIVVDDDDLKVSHFADASRKLAKLCAKTSISEDPSKLPEEALRYVSAQKRHNRHNYSRTSLK